MAASAGAGISRLVATTKPQAILHLAAMAGVRPSIEQPAYYARVNVEGVVQQTLLEAWQSAPSRAGWSAWLRRLLANNLGDE